MGVISGKLFVLLEVLIIYIKQFLIITHGDHEIICHGSKWMRFINI